MSDGGGPGPAARGSPPSGAESEVRATIEAMRVAGSSAALVAALVVAGPAPAGAAPASDAPRRVVARGPLPGDLARRLSAQLVDVPWTLEVAPDAGLRPGLDADLELAERRGADAVLFLRATTDRVQLWLTDARAGRQYRRDVAALEADGPGPVTLEAVAIAVRGSLEALRRGDVVDWALEAARPRWVLELGGFGGAAGDGLVVHPSLGLQVDLRRGRWGLAAAAWVGVARGLTRAPAELSLARHGARLDAGYRWPLGSRFDVEFTAGAGVSVTRRRTRATPGVSPTPARTLVSGLVGVGARLGVDLGAARLWLGGGLDAVLGAPRLEVEGPAGRERVAAAWPVAPWAGLGGAVRFGDGL